MWMNFLLFCLFFCFVLSQSFFPFALQCKNQNNQYHSSIQTNAEE